MSRTRAKEPTASLGPRLVALRKASGLTQLQLAEAAGISQRALSSYETEVSYPPLPVAAALARSLKVSADELLGLKPPPKALRREPDPDTRRLWKKFQKVLSLPEKDQRAVIRLINSLAAGSNGRR